MKSPDIRSVLRGLAVILAVLTLFTSILFLVQRHRIKAAVRDDFAQRRDALEERIRALIDAEAQRLLAINPDEGGLKGTSVRLIIGEELDWEQQVGDRNLYTGLVRSGTPAISVGVALPDQEFAYLRQKLSLDAVVDAMREVHPGRKGHVYVTDVNGDPVLRWPREAKSTEHRKFKRSTVALDAIAEAGDGLAEGRPDTVLEGGSTYKDLDDREAAGSWMYSEYLHGGVVIEQDQRVAFAPVRGAQPWHVTGALLSITLLVLLALLLIPRSKFTGDLFRLYAYAKRFWPFIVLAVACMGIYAGANMLRLALMKTVFDDVLLGKGAGALDALQWALSWFAVIVVVMAASNWFKEFITEYVTQGIVNDIRCALSAHILTLDMKFFDRQQTGDLMSRLSNDVGMTRRTLSLIFGEFFQEPLMLLGALGAAFITNWRLSLMVFLGFPLLVFPIYRLGRLVKKYSKRRQVQRSVVTQVIMQTVTGVRTVKAFQMEAYENERLRETSHELLKQSVRVARTTALSKTIIDLMNNFGGLLVLAFGGYMVINGIAETSAADLMTLSVILAHMYKPVKSLTKTYNKIQEALPGAERIFEIMDIQPEIANKPDALPLSTPRRDVAFERVTFAYDTDAVLRDVSFRVNVGEVVALVGETGAGKSTVTDLVARFYDPTVGRVTLDGVDLRDYDVMQLRGTISSVSQDAFLFHATVKENIRYARPSATEEEIVEAAKNAGIHEEILKMEHGYDTVVGDRGTRLSGGQRQRVTIARALLKDSPILILDEATSALDSQTETLIQNALNHLMQGRTTFVIAHRLSTISHADRILVFKEGRLVEQGTHHELVAREGGVYENLHRIQFAQTNGQ